MKGQDMGAWVRWVPRTAGLIASLFVLGGITSAAAPYVVTNDDSPFPFRTGVSFYSVAPDGLLTLQQQVQTVGYGTGGGFFGANRLVALSNGSQACVFASSAGTGDLVGIDVNTLAVGGSAVGSNTDTGASNGIGLAVNDQYLYASYTDSNTIGTFKVLSGCGLMFVNDVAVAGIEGGIINGMAVHGNVLIATYTDGTIESFDISNGPPVSHGDRQISTGASRSRGASFPNSVDITSDGHFALFGDTSTSMVVEVSDISSGKLTPTRVYTSTARISSSNIILSPDESLLYVVNTQGDAVSAIFFNKKTGKLSPGCSSNRIKGESRKWSYLAGVALVSPTGNGSGVYVAQFGDPPGIATVALSSSVGKCSLREVPHSRVTDPHSPGLLSIGTFPPRSFQEIR